MKVLATNEMISDGQMVFEAELVPANEHEHGLLANIFARRANIVIHRLNKPGNLMAIRVEISPIPEKPLRKR